MFSLIDELVGTVGARAAFDTLHAASCVIARLTEPLALDAAVRVGLMPGVPDVQATAGFTRGF